MTPFERTYLISEPFMPPLYGRVRRLIRSALNGSGNSSRVLDVGGRKSHYTIGIPASITITDLPRETDLQSRMNLGINSEIVNTTLCRRSNVEQILFDDMTKSTLQAESFDLVVAVEVLEHVEEDDAFVQNVARVLRSGGHFLMTTPNGDSVPNTNPDHKRHYTRANLQSLLAQHFREVQVQYDIRGGRCRKWGLESWSLKRPLRTAMSMFGNFVNRWQSNRADVGQTSHGTRHLVAHAIK